MRVLSSNRPPLFGLDEVSGIAIIDPHVIRTWVRKGKVTPVVRGHQGPNSQSMFDAKAALGITIAAGLLKSPGGCSQGYAERMIKLFSEMSDEALLHFLGEGDTWTEEDYAAWRHGPAFPRTTTTEDLEGVDEFMLRVDRAKKMIRHRLGLGVAEKDKEPESRITTAG